MVNLNFILHLFAYLYSDVSLRLFAFFWFNVWLVTCRIVYLVPGVSELCQIAEPAMWVGSWHRWLGMMAEVKLPVGSPAFDTVGSWSLCPDAFVGSLVSGTWSAVLAKMPRVSRAVVLLVAEAHQVLRLLSPAAGWAESWHGKLGVCVCGWDLFLPGLLLGPRWPNIGAFRLVSRVGLEPGHKAISCWEDSKTVLHSTSSEMVEPTPQSGRHQCLDPQGDLCLTGRFVRIESSSDQAPFKLLLLLWLSEHVKFCWHLFL